jgi:hypothetical protein
VRRHWYDGERRRIEGIIPPHLREQIASLSEPQRIAVMQCFETLGEQLEIIFARFDYCMQAADALGEITLRVMRGDKHSPDAETLDNLQFDYVNHSEAFHLSFYNVLSWGLRLVELVAPHGLFRKVKFSSVEGSLLSLPQQSLVSDVCAELALLLKIIRLRNDFLVHPNVRRPWSWMTVGMEGAYRVLYFFRATTSEVAARALRRPLYREAPVFDPDDHRFRPPVANAGFVVAPEPKAAMDALWSVLLTLILTVDAELGRRVRGAASVLEVET